MAESDDDEPWDWGALVQHSRATHGSGTSGAAADAPLPLAGVPPLSDSRRNNAARAPASRQQQRRTSTGMKYDAVWVQTLHDEIQRDAVEHGIQAFKWSHLLEKWREHIRDAPYERVDLACVKKILQHARLTSASASPMNYETLRRLGKDILVSQVDEVLLERLKPCEADTKYYRGFFGREDKWSLDYLQQHLKTLHGSSNLDIDMSQEKLLGFIVAHVRSNRYNAVELRAIVKDLVKDLEGIETWKQASKALQDCDGSEREAQSFILHFVEAHHRDRQSLEGTVKRAAAAGVLLFGDVFACNAGSLPVTQLDRWWDDHRGTGPAGGLQLEATLEEIDMMIDEEFEWWKEWRDRLKKQRPDIKIKEHPLFSMLSPDNLATPALIPNILSIMKTYGEKKANLKEWALKSSKTAIVRAIVDLDLNQQEQLSSHADERSERGGRQIAVFGYHMGTNGQGQPDRPDDISHNSVIVRCVPLTRKHADGQASAGETGELLDRKIFELGISIAGNYVRISPKNEVDLKDMLTTSGLGLKKDDQIYFFQFVKPGTHCPSSKPIAEILSSSSHEDDGQAFTHVLLTFETSGGGSNSAQLEIADAGGRFLIDLNTVGSVKTEGMRYQPLAVEPTASVATSEDGKFSKRPFRRLAVLLPPSMSDYELNRLSGQLERGRGFSESAEIIAEVLSLVLIDRTNLDDGQYKDIIQQNLKENPLLLYYASIELLDTVNSFFAQITAEYWEQQLRFSGSNFAHLSRQEQEARDIILNLITSYRSIKNDGVNRQIALGGVSAAKTPRDPMRRSSQISPAQNVSAVSTKRCSIGKRVALATEAHLSQLPALISSETHFASEEIFVEETNFESTLQRLKRASPTSLTFVFVYITGRISADQISQIVTVPVPAIKLIFRYSSSIIDLLELWPAFCDIIYKPQSICEELTSKLRPVSYTPKCAVGCVVDYTLCQLRSNPELIGKPGYYWDFEYPEGAVGKGMLWKEHVRQWLQDEQARDESAFVRIQKTSDDHATAQALQTFLLSLEPPMDVRVVDAGDRKKFDDLKHFFDSKASGTSLSYSNTVGTPFQGSGEGNGTMGVTREVFILTHAKSLPHTRLEVLVSRCATRGTKLILLVAEASASISRFRVFKDPRVPPIWIRVPQLTQKQLGGINASDDHLVDSSSFASRPELLAFVGLQLLYSPEAVVTEEHQHKVWQFLETKDPNPLEFLSNFDSLEGDAGLRCEMVQYLADTAVADLEAAGPMKVAKCADCVALVLAMHINRYMRFRQSPHTMLISFSDFCCQPKLRFLSQIHRIEAYIWYLFLRTAPDMRLGGTHKDRPLGWPLGACFKELSNVHHAFNPGPIMRCKASEVTSSNVSFAMPAPQYIDPGKGDVVTQMQEIVEHRALAACELHWQEMHDKWQSGPELTDDVLDHLLVYSPCRISLLLSMTPSQVVNLNLSENAIRAVSNDFEGCEDLLRSLPAREYPELRTRTAAIWWLLLTEGGSVKRVDDKGFGEDQGLLLDAGIFIEPKAQHGEEEQTDLLGRVARVMMQLDSENTLMNQHSVRDFILADARRDVIQKLLCDAKVVLGNAFISAVVARETLNSILVGSCGSIIFDRFGAVLQWVKESNEANEKRMREQMLSASLSSRITSAAIVTLLKSANPPVDLEKARTGILMPCVDARDADHKQRFLDEILQPLCEHRPEMAVEVLELVAKCNGDMPEPSLKEVPSLWIAMFRALREPEEHTQAFILEVQSYMIESNMSFRLPFEASETLCSLYIDACKKKDYSHDDLERHSVVLGSVTSRTAVFKCLMKRKGEILRSSSLTALLYFTWWSAPGESIPLHLLPKPTTWERFKEVTRRVKPDGAILSKGMSILARFACAPHTLPASILNTLHTTMVGDLVPVNSNTYVLAQKDSTVYPVYAFRTHLRPLPKECIEHLVTACKGHRNMKADLTPADKISFFFPWTDSGVSEKTVTHNLDILVNVSNAELTIPIDEEDEKQKMTSELRAQLFLTTWIWFEAAGFSMQDLKDMCASSQHKDLISKNKIEMSAVWEREGFSQALVFQSLPVYVDVRFCSGKDVALFQCSQESVSVTMQWLAMLTMHYQCSLEAPQQFYDYTVAMNDGGAQQDAAPAEIVKKIFENIAAKLVERRQNLELAPASADDEHEAHHIVFVLDDSGSMSGRPWAALVQAVKQYLNVRQGLDVNDLISIVIYNSSARVACESMPLSECARHADSLLQFQSGGTSFRAAFQQTLAVLQQGPSNIPSAIIFMSDGGCNDGENELRAIKAAFAEVKFDAVAFGSGADTRKLQVLSEIVGGRMKEAKNAASLSHKFAEVANQLSRRPRNSGNEAQQARDASIARACAEVVNDILPIVDFFGQLRASGSGDFVSYALDGLSTGLQTSSVALQVCIADALYMLLGITPANQGREVLSMLQMWKDKQLTIGSSIKKEIDYMSSNVWELGELTTLLVETLRSMNIRKYVRNPASTPLAGVLRAKQPAALYTFNEGITQMACPNRTSGAHDQRATAASTAGASQNKPGRVKMGRQKADFDHAGGVRSSRDHIDSEQKISEGSVLEDNADFFCAAAKDDHSTSLAQTSVRQMRRLAATSCVKARTISARDLVQIDTPGGGFAIIRIVPGLHPVLRSPGDSCAIPVLQQKTLGSGKDSIERSHDISQSKIEAIFSHNGATWDHLNQLPPGSTLMGNGFYYRKGCDGTWVLLLGASSPESLEKPPYLLWSCLDTARLAALDFDSRVLDIFKSIVALAYNPDEIDKQNLSDSYVAEMLKSLRRSAALAPQDQEKAHFYDEYVQREAIICQHLHDVVSRIKDDTIGKSTSATVASAFNRKDLEKKLEIPVNSTEKWANGLCNVLGLLVGIRDWVPRSQLAFTIELVLRNSQSVKRKMQELCGGELDAASGDDDGEEQVRGDDEDDGIYLNEDGDVALDLSPYSSRRAAIGEEDQQTAFSGIENRLIAAHEHITQKKFNKNSLDVLNRMSKRKRFKNDAEWVRDFEDSDSDDDDKLVNARKTRNQDVTYGEEDSDGENLVLQDARRERSLGSASVKTDPYEDDELDRPLKTECDAVRDAIFPSGWGYGPPLFSGVCVTSILSEHVPLYHVQIDVRRLKISYSDAEGLPVAYLFHKKILRRSLQTFVPDAGFAVFFEEEEDSLRDDLAVDGEREIPDEEFEMKMKEKWTRLTQSERDCYTRNEKGESATLSGRASYLANYRMMAYREELLRWLVDLIRSPLPTSAIHWFLDKLENGATTQSVPSLSASVGACSLSEEEKGGNLNLLVIAHCIAKALPDPNEAKDLFSSAFHIPRSFVRFTQRKNDTYGIHVVRGGTLKELQDHGAVVEVCDLGYDALTRSKDNASMYLSIINKFSKFIWLVYVIGLDVIDDALLKWLAEYTRAHPWRFVYLENTQTSWNFSENRDRCVYDYAPLPVERGLKCEEDLKRPEVEQLRPTHKQPYPRISSHCRMLNRPEEQIPDMDWDDLSKFTLSFFRGTSQVDEQATGWSTRVCKNGEDDYRKTVRALMENKDPCVLLLCSPPGAGKSHFSSELAELVKTKIGLRRAFIDGSDDRLVDMALAEILDVELPDPSRPQLLVVDEFHMLKEHHKKDLFDWLHLNARRLHVLLIANRKDARDEELLGELRKQSSNIGLCPQRIQSFSTRLGKTLVQEVMEKRKTQYQDYILRWMHCSRCLFGGEAVSLRGITRLEQCLGNLELGSQTSSPSKDLVDLFLNKVPTISEATAQEFVACFIASLDKDAVDAIAAVKNAVRGPVSLMMQASLLTEQEDLVGLDFGDFLASEAMKRAYDASPALRIAAWCCQMRDAVSDLKDCRGMLDRMDRPKMIFRCAFVDQCGFPLQLEEPCSLGMSECLAFSWGGDYTCMRDIIDAVKHGHSVDWTDVHERCWKCEPVQDSALLVELLSVCTSPGKVLGAVTKENLCSLLKKSKASDVCQIARDVLKYQCHKSTAQEDRFNSPYRTAVWMIILKDHKLSQTRELLELMGGDDVPSSSAEELDWRESELSDGLAWASTHMMDMRTVCSEDEPKARLKFLIDCLVYLSHRLIDTKSGHKVAPMWGGMMAPLLRIAKPLPQNPGQNSNRILVHVAIHGEDCNSKWNEPLPSLWAIAHGKGTALHVDKLWNNPDYKHLLFEGGSDAKDGRGKLIPKLAGGVLDVGGVIPYELQEALLTGDCFVDISKIENLQESEERAMGLVRGALEMLVKDDPHKIKIQPGTFKSLVDKEIKRIHEQNRSV